MMRFRWRRACQFPVVESGSVSNETFRKSRKRRTSPAGSDKKQRTLFHPCSPSCKDNSRANISVPPMRRGSTPNTDTSVWLRRGRQPFVEVVCIRKRRSVASGRFYSQRSAPSRSHTFAKLFQAKRNAQRRAVSSVNQRRIFVTDECRLKICLVSETKNPLVILGEISQKRRVEK